MAPNVIFVLTDDQGYPPLGAHGHPFLKTPHLDAFHGEAVRFEQFHSGTTCAPTRAGLMTGHYCNSTGVWHTVGGRSLLRGDHTPIALALRTAAEVLKNADDLSQVVLITDGMETCKGDPAREAEVLAKASNFRSVEVIGLGGGLLSTLFLYMLWSGTSYTIIAVSGFVVVNSIALLCYVVGMVWPLVALFRGSRIS